MTQTIKTLIDLSTDKVADYEAKRLNAETEQIELVKSAMKKISNYLLDISRAGFCGVIKYKGLNLYWLNRNDTNVETRFEFTSKGVEIYEGSAGSHLSEKFEFDKEIEDWRWTSDTLPYMAKRMVKLWSNIKPELEAKLQLCLTQRMAEAEARLVGANEVNKMLLEFEV